MAKKSARVGVVTRDVTLKISRRQNALLNKLLRTIQSLALIVDEIHREANA